MSRSTPRAPFRIGVMIWMSNSIRVNVARQLFPHQRQHGADNGISAVLLRINRKSLLRLPSGIRPPSLILWALTMMSLSAAWRKIRVSCTTSKAPDAIRSRSTLPGPTLGSWFSVPHQDQAGSGVHCPQKCMHQMNVHHGHLINDDQHLHPADSPHSRSKCMPDVRRLSSRGDSRQLQQTVYRPAPHSRLPPSCASPPGRSGAARRISISSCSK